MIRNEDILTLGYQAVTQLISKNSGEYEFIVNYVILLMLHDLFKIVLHLIMIVLVSLSKISDCFVLL